MFNKTNKRYLDKFNMVRNDINAKVDLESVLKSHGYTLETLKSDLLNKTDKFNKLVLSIASKVTVGKVASTSYSAVVACLAELLGLGYSCHAGFCIKKDSPKYSFEIKEFNKRKEEGRLPILSTHFYITINNTDYDYFNSEINSDNIDKLYVVQLG